MTPSIASIQATIKAEFATLGHDRELLLSHLIDLGRQLAPLAEKDKIPDHLVPGCLAKVWLVHQPKKHHLWLYADSNATITKGLISLLVRIFSGQTLQAILDAPPLSPSSLGLSQIIGVQRHSGFAHMLNTIKQHAFQAHKKSFSA